MYCFLSPPTGPRAALLLRKGLPRRQRGCTRCVDLHFSPPGLRPTGLPPGKGHIHSVPPPPKRERWVRGSSCRSGRHALGRSLKRNMRSKIRTLTEFCNSHYVSHFAAFFIVARAKISIVESCLWFVSPARKGHPPRKESHLPTSLSSVLGFRCWFEKESERSLPR